MELTEGQRRVMEAHGHLLVTGGPGSGKTTISIIKAAQIADQRIGPGQKMLFLSFARATVSRVVEAIERDQKISDATKRLIDVDTYHAFFWRVLRTHGYLIGLPRRLALLTPASEAIALSEIRSGFPARKLLDEQKKAKKCLEAAELIRLAMDDGRISFDFFASYVGDILRNSGRVRRLVATMYPVIILDEFQDTNAAQWLVLQALGESCRLIALADPEQRIYDWIGADSARLDHFRSACAPVEVDLSTDNHRSAGTDIAIFGNDVLSGNFRQQKYKDVMLDSFMPFRDPAMTRLVTIVYAARKRLVTQNIENWSVAILVPTKRMTRLVSDALRHPPAGLNAVSHTAMIEMEAAILGAEIIAALMQPLEAEYHFTQLIDVMCNYFRGKGGDKPTQGALKEATRIREAHGDLLRGGQNRRALRKNSVLIPILAVYDQIRALAFVGDPDKDWRAVRGLLENGQCARLKEIADEVKNIRLLERGSELRQQLAQDWRDNRYGSALEIIRKAFVREHFSMSSKPESGVIVMNMHKAKGKQFDEVINFEGWPIPEGPGRVSNRDRIVYGNSRGQINDQARQTFRVGVTRARRRVTILTPRTDPCVLLPKY